MRNGSESGSFFGKEDMLPFRIWLWRIIVFGGVFVLFSLAGLELYTRTPTSFAIQPLGLGDETRHVVLIFHGSQDGDNPTFEKIADRYRSLTTAQLGTVVINYNWSAGADDRLRAGATAIQLGQELGQELAELDKLESLRLIAHSAGAYVPDSLCEAYRANVRHPAHLEITFLDPFGLRGFVDWTHGVRTHGRCADFASVYLNTNDPAPAGNTPLEQAFTIDVTDSPEREGFPRNGHYWPVQYFLNTLDARQVMPSARMHAKFPRGVTQTVAADASQD